jgi:SAM-dependent methyltransferase
MSGKLGSYATDAKLFQKVESIPGEQALYKMAEKEVRAELDRLRRPATVIDLCCGTCEILSRIAPHPKIGRFIGVDKERDYLDFAKSRLTGIDGIELVLGDAAECDLGASAEIIIASSAYHHIENERKTGFLRNIIRHMKPDAKVVFAENILPSFEDEDGRIIAARSFYGKRIEEARELGMDDEVLALLRQVMDFEVRREYEWKVDYTRFMRDLEGAGFEIMRKNMVWPTDSGFADPLAGDYVLVAELPAWYM